MNAYEEKAYAAAADLLDKHPDVEQLDLLALAYLMGSRDGNQEAVDRIDEIATRMEKIGGRG